MIIEALGYISLFSCVIFGIRFCADDHDPLDGMAVALFLIAAAICFK